MQPSIKLIVAHDSNRGISKNGKIPWKIDEDMKFFTDMTKHNGIGKCAIVMGRKTFESMNSKPLLDRLNIIITSQQFENIPTFSTDTSDKNLPAIICKSIEQSIELCTQLQINTVYICGGTSIYKEAIEKLEIDAYYVTTINKDYNCDNCLDYYDFGNPITPSKSFIVKDKNDNSDVRITFSKYGNERRMNTEEDNYLQLLYELSDMSELSDSRNSLTVSTFGRSLKFDLSRYPLLTSKSVFFRGIVEELLFFISGSTDTNILKEKGINIWEPNTNRQFLDKNGKSHYAEGDMGPMYGFNLRHFGAEYKGAQHDYTGQGLDQLDKAIKQIKNSKGDRRILMTTYNPLNADEGVLYPCHGLTIQFNVNVDGKLDCAMYQRSADIVCGVPFNIASYALLVYMLCEIVNNDEIYTGVKLSPGQLIMSFGNVHLYEQHYGAAIQQILRDPKPFPQLQINRKVNDINDFKFSDFTLIDYNKYPPIKVSMVA